MRTDMRKVTLSLLALTVLWAVPALELDLQGARKSGQIAENASGYAVALDQSPEVGKLVADVNAKRKAEYMRISKENGQPVDVVAKLAAEQVIAKLPAGAMYLDSSGNLKKR